MVKSRRISTTATERTIFTRIRFVFSPLVSRRRCGAQEHRVLDKVTMAHGITTTTAYCFILCLCLLLCPVSAIIRNERGKNCFHYVMFLVFSIPNPNPIELKCHQQHTVCPSLFSCFVRGRLLTEVVKFKMLQKFKKSKHSGI